MSRILKKRRVKVLMQPVVWYGYEAWTLLHNKINRLKALEAFLWRGLEKISWRDKMHTDEVFVRVNEERCRINEIRQ